MTSNCLNGKTLRDLAVVMCVHASDGAKYPSTKVCNWTHPIVIVFIARFVIKKPSTLVFSVASARHSLLTTSMSVR